MRRITAAILLAITAATPAAAQEQDAPCTHLRGQPIPWLGCMAEHGLASFSTPETCLLAVQAGLYPAFYCTGGLPPTTEAYPTGADVKPIPVYRECTPCLGMFALDPDRCTPVEQYDQAVCDSKKTHGDDQVQAQAAEVFHADGDPWQWHYVAAKKHAEGMEARALQAEAALAAAKTKCGRRCR